MSGPRLLLVANPAEFHLGGHLAAAADALGVTHTTVDVRGASGGRWLDRLSWRLRDHRLARMGWFERNVRRACDDFRPDLVLATGLAPVGKATLAAIGKAGVRRANFLSDDPWNPAVGSRWFLAALPEYDVVFSPRRSNLGDLTAAGVPRAEYLPFAYNPAVHRPPDAPPRPDLGCDVLFVGGADRDRVPLIEALAGRGLTVALYGGYWDRHPTTRPFARGMATPDELRGATVAAKVVLCLVRRANRDGHVMRSFEAAAIGGCILAEDTPEHREIFGDSVAYFADPDALTVQAERLAGDPAARAVLAAAVRRRIARGGNTYTDRLTVVLDQIIAASPPGSRR